MYIPLILASLAVLSNGGVVGEPKMYNNLILSDENVSNVHAIPVVEPTPTAPVLDFTLPTIENMEAIEDLEIDRAVMMGRPCRVPDESKIGDETTILPEVSSDGPLFPLEHDSTTTNYKNHP